MARAAKQTFRTVGLPKYFHWNSFHLTLKDLVLNPVSTWDFLCVRSRHCHTTTNQPTRESYKLGSEESHRLGRDMEWTFKLLCGMLLKLQHGRLCSKVTIWGRENTLHDRASLSSTPTSALLDCGLSSAAWCKWSIIWKPDQQLKPALGVLWELQSSPINEKDSVQARRECESSFEESSSVRVRETSLPMPTLINRGTCFLISYFSFQAFAWIYFNRSIAILSQLYLWERRLYSSDYFLLLHLSSPC